MCFTGWFPGHDIEWPQHSLQLLDHRTFSYSKQLNFTADNSTCCASITVCSKNVAITFYMLFHLLPLSSINLWTGWFSVICIDKSISFAG